jgi:hypothetical protein
MLLGSFDHCGQQEEGQERGGEMVDLEAVVVIVSAKRWESE